MDRMLAHRIGLAGERGLVHGQLRPGEDDTIGRKRFAGRDDGKVADNHLVGGHLDLRAGPNDTCSIGQQTAQPLRRRLSTPVQVGVHPDQRQDRDE